jgi:hypothetical protein
MKILGVSVTVKKAVKRVSHSASFVLVYRFIGKLHPEISSPPPLPGSGGFPPPSRGGDYQPSNRIPLPSREGLGEGEISGVAGSKEVSALDYVESLRKSRTS